MIDDFRFMILEQITSLLAYKKAALNENDLLSYIQKLSFNNP